MTKAVPGTHVGTPLLDVAGGSRSRIKPSFNNSWILSPPSRSWLLAGHRLKAVFVTCPHLREPLECVWFTSETTEARLAAGSQGTGFPWLFQKLLRFLAVPISLSIERLLWKTLHPLFLPFLPSRFLSALSMAYFQRVFPCFLPSWHAPSLRVRLGVQVAQPSLISHWSKLLPGSHYQYTVD